MAVNHRAACKDVRKAGGCLMGPQGPLLSQRSCQLLVPAKAVQIAVVQGAAGPDYPVTAGLRMEVEHRGPLDGYVEFYGRCLLYEFDLPCPEGQCAAGPMLLEEAKRRCDAWPECQAFVFGPQGLGALSGRNLSGPLAAFKGAGPGQFIDMSRSSLSSSFMTFVKMGGLEPPAAAFPVGMLSAFRSTGTVLVVICLAIALSAVGVVLWWRSHQPSRYAASETKPILGAGPDGPVSSADGSPTLKARQSSQDTCLELGSMTQLWEPTVSCSLGAHVEDSAAGVQALDLSCFTDAPGLQWADVLVPREAIELCRDSSGGLEKLGRGASGEVYRAVMHPGENECAAKIFRFKGLNSTPKHFIQEIRTLWRTNHPNIVQFLGASIDDEEGLLLMELMSGGDLASRMHDQLPDGKGRLFAWRNQGARVALQVAVGLAYLHRQRIVHLDLKPENVLLTKDGDAKLGDVGFSRLLLQDHLSSSSLDGQCGTFNYCAPEVLLGQKATEKADCFSFGVWLWELLKGERPVRGTLSPLSAPQDCPPEVAALQGRCVDYDPRQRPSAAEIVAVLTGCGTKRPDRAGKGVVPDDGGSGESQHRSSAGQADICSVVRSVQIPKWRVPPSPMLASQRPFLG
ncbi:hypothetical protein N2152v2_002393 [Parachlorella kessleri]